MGWRLSFQIWNARFQESERYQPCNRPGESVVFGSLATCNHQRQRIPARVMCPGPLLLQVVAPRAFSTIAGSLGAARSTRAPANVEPFGPSIPGFRYGLWRGGCPRPLNSKSNRSDLRLRSRVNGHLKIPQVGKALACSARPVSTTRGSSRETHLLKRGARATSLPCLGRIGSGHNRIGPALALAG
jgi:hypothetical protein